MYASLDDMRTRVGEEELLNVAHTADGAFDAEAVAAALTDATEMVDGYVSARYRVPLEPVPAPVRRWCVDIAFYYLHTFKPTEQVRQAFEDALTGLKDVARGLVTLQCEGVRTIAPAEGGAVQTSGTDRVFSGESLRGF